MPRQRYVHDSGQIAHLWAHATQDSARNPQGNFSFSGENLISYTTTIARRITRRGEIVFLLAARRWSPTTDKHQSAARSAAHGVNVYAVANIHATTYAEHKANVLDILARAEQSALSAARSRRYADMHAKNFADLVARAQSYAKLFNVRGVKFPAADDVAEIGRKAKERSDAARREETAAQRERNARKQRKTEFLASIADKVVAQWRADGSAYATEFEGRAGTINIDRVTRLRETDFMRLDGDDVVTSRGARVPAGMVRRMVPIVLRLMSAAGADPVYVSAAFPGKTLRVGHFAINQWNNRMVWVGCHGFSRAEVETIGDILAHAEVVPTAADDTADNTSNG